MQIATPVTFGEAIKLGFANYAKFTGRTRRREYFYFMLFLFILFMVLSWFFLIPQEPFIFLSMGLFTIYFFVTFFPFLSSTVRRLHDTGRSGVYIFIGIIPIAGFFILLYFLCLDSEEGQNEYGPSVKYISPQGNNYNPPANVVAIPVATPNVIYTPPPVVTVYPQPNPMAPPTVPYAQPNPMAPPTAYPQPNPMAPQVPTYPPNPMVPPQAYPQQPPVDPYYNSSDFRGQ